MAFATHEEGARRFLGKSCKTFECDEELPNMTAVAARLFDSLQFTHHCDAFCEGGSMKAALSGADPRSQLCGFEVVLTKFAGTDACPAGLEFFRGWGGHERCACDANRLRSQRGRCAACATT